MKIYGTKGLEKCVNKMVIGSGNSFTTSGAVDQVMLELNDGSSLTISPSEVNGLQIEYYTPKMEDD